MIPAQPGLRTHQLPTPDFVALASGHGDAAVVARLKKGRLSKHLLLVRALLDVAPAGSTGHLHAGLALLSDVQQVRPDIVGALLGHPHTGAWAAHCLRVIRGTASGTAPVETDLGQLAATAASAAIRAGMRFEIDVPARDGAANLPTLGRALVRSGVNTVRVVGLGDGVIIDGRELPADLSVDRPGWQPVRRLSAEAGGSKLTVELDDVDPYRNCHRLGAADRLDPATVATWQRCFEIAWPLLVRHHPRYAEAIGQGLVTLVPLAAQRATRGVNATSMDAFGAVFLSPPADGQALALALVHEFQHAKLAAVLDLVPLHDGSPEARYYAPWRDDPRPLGGLFHGAYAFLGVTDFWRVQRSLPGNDTAEFATFEFARWRERVSRVLDVLAESGRLTAAGDSFVAGMRATVDGWLREPVRSEVRVLARDAADDHHTGWRVRNLRPDPQYVHQLAKAWQAGDPPPVDTGGPAVVTPGARALVHNVRLDLAGLRIRDPDRFQQLAGDPAALADAVPEATAGDIACARGDHATAIAEYRRIIAAQPDRGAHWAGLTVALRRLGASPAVTALLQRPEVVVAVYREVALRVAPPHPDVLADWLAGPEADEPLSGPDSAEAP